ncbi:MAG: cobalamin biosynthesis protein P47K [Gemmataceae bacterium]|nr:cobalamin biosynthesis protein P47K [Gemmataceae bacterium]
MKKLQYIMLGGFLGAGKTTALARLAKHFTSLGKSVGIVTNDQAEGLVDTLSLRSQGYAVEEVPGACFCCRFDDLVKKVGSLEESRRPDVLLAEPVGSCTDLVATVLQPLADLYASRFELAPYVVLFKPSHGLRILRGEKGQGFSPKAAYIFEKQLEEADAIAINRADELSPEELRELQSLLKQKHPATPLLILSAKTGLGFDAFLEFLGKPGAYGKKILGIDYDIYAEGEAELGWVNAGGVFQSKQLFPLDDLLVDLVTSLGRDIEGEVAHLKVIGLAEATYGVANLVANSQPVELSLPSRALVSEGELVVNARVAMDPAVLASRVKERVAEVLATRGASLDWSTVQAFRPGRPQPTHRYAKSVN